MVQVASSPMSADGTETLKASPPTTWWRWGDGRVSGFTSGSMRSMTSWEQPNRSMVGLLPPPPPNWGAASARAARARRAVQCIVL